MGSAEESRHLEDCIENYGMLSRLFRLEVDADLLNDLVDSPCVDETGNVEFDEGYGKMRSFLDSISDIAHAKSDLAIDYSLVFLGYGVDPDTSRFSEREARPLEESTARKCQAIIAPTRSCQPRRESLRKTT